MSTHNLCSEQKYEKYQNFLSENFPFLVVTFSIYLNRRVFVMDCGTPWTFLLPFFFSFIKSLHLQQCSLRNCARLPAKHFSEGRRKQLCRVTYPERQIRENNMQFFWC